MTDTTSPRSGTTPTIVHWLDGKPWAGTSERTSPVFNPATGAVTSQGALASTADVDTIVGPARAAPDDWRRVSLTRRVQVLFAFRE
ncbi:MAG: aldehyde dehydrogenase family protein, partial [Acidimicrobiales bacterium]